MTHGSDIASFLFVIKHLDDVLLCSRAKGKRTPKKNLKHGQNGTSKSKISDSGVKKGSSDISNPGIFKSSNVYDEMDSGKTCFHFHELEILA